MQRRILIADPSPANRVIFQVRLGDGYFRPLLASDAASCLKAARREHPDLIVIDCDLHDMPGPQLITTLRADPRTRHLPLIALVPADAPQRRLAALRAGADDVMTRTQDLTFLLARIRNLLRQREESQLMARAWGGDMHGMLGLPEQQKTPFQPTGPIGLVASRPEAATAWKQKLAPRLRENARVLTPSEATVPGYGIQTAQANLFLIEADCGSSGAGLRLMTQLAGISPFRHSMFCIIAPEASDCAALALDLGAHDVVDPSVSAEELDLRLRALLRRKHQADAERQSLEAGLRLAVIDPLTGAYNRRYAFPRLAGIAEQSALEGSEFAVLVLDLDRFKSVNDRFGHATGDAVLIEVARRLRESLRADDLLARIGGEEFLIALPDTTSEDAARIAEQLRFAVGERPITGANGVELKVTISIGMKTGGGMDAGQEDITEMVAAADVALMRSKTLGRNVVTLCPSAA